MKQQLLFILLFIATCATAQTVNIPDVNFKNRLVRSTSAAFTAKDSSGNNIAVDSNADGEIQETEAQAVYSLNVTSSAMSNLQGIRSFTNLRVLSCGGNNVTTLDLAGLNNLVTLNAYDNLLTTLTLTGCSSLTELNCYENNLTTIDLTGLSGLRRLHCRNNRLTSIDLSPVNLINFYASDNLFTTVDFSAQTNLRLFNLFGNTRLTSVNVKNGTVQYFNGEELGGCPNFTSICLDADEYDVAYNSIIIANSWHSGWNINTVSFSTTCGEPGEYDNLITGTVRFDSNNNGCDTHGLLPSFTKVNAVHNGSTSSIWTTNTGYYSFLAQMGDYTISPDLTGMPYFTSSASTPISFNALDGTIVTQDFCISADGVHPDLEVTAGAFNGITAGSSQRYWLTYKNKGNQVLTGNITFAYNNNALTVTGIYPGYTTNAPGLLTCNFTNLQPFEMRTVMVTMQVNTPTSPYPVNIGDVLNFTLTGNSTQTDETPEDNQIDFHQTVQYSQDPNNIVCLEGDTVSVNKIGEYLHYTINFENIGTAAAGFVVVTNEIDTTKYNVQSLQVLNSSHRVTATLTGTTLKFRFTNINLAPNARGSVSFKIKTLETLTAGDAVMSRASIVFDENEAIVTNEAISTFAVLGKEDFTNNTIKVYPNPTSGSVSIIANSLINVLELYDVQGRLLQSAKVNSTSAALDITNKPQGMYILKVISDNGIATEKILKN